MRLTTGSWEPSSCHAPEERRREDRRRQRIETFLREESLLKAARLLRPTHPVSELTRIREIVVAMLESMHDRDHGAEWPSVAAETTEHALVPPDFPGDQD